MFYSFHLKDCKFVHKHWQLGVVNALVDIEYPGQFFRIAQLSTILNSLSERELERLYKQAYETTEYPDITTMRQHLTWYAEAMDENDVDETEVISQARYIDPRDNKAYVYTKGAFYAHKPVLKKAPVKQQTFTNNPFAKPTA